MTKFLLLWKPWKGTRQFQPQAAAVATIVPLPIILRHTEQSYNAQEHLYQQKDSQIAEKCQQFAKTRHAELCFNAFEVQTCTEGLRELWGRSNLCCQFGVITPLKL